MFKVGDYAIYTGTSITSLVKSGEIIKIVDSEYLGGNDEYDLVYFIRGGDGTTGQGLWVPPTLLKEVPEDFVPFNKNGMLGGDNPSSINLSDKSVRFDYILPDEYWR